MKLIQILSFFISLNLYSQVRDTIIIRFDDSLQDMEKVNFYISDDSKASFTYLIEQKEKTYPYDNKFSFSHYNKSKKLRDRFGENPPMILRSKNSFLEGKRVLDKEFFRTTPYRKVCKTFEEEDSWEQDVIIFIMDVDEMKNDSIVLRQVNFSRPVKQ